MNNVYGTNKISKKVLVMINKTIKAVHFPNKSVNGWDLRSDNLVYQSQYVNTDPSVQLRIYKYKGGYTFAIGWLQDNKFFVIDGGNLMNDQIAEIFGDIVTIKPDLLIELCKYCNEDINRNKTVHSKIGLYDEGKEMYNAILRGKYRSTNLCNFCYSCLVCYRDSI